MRFSALAAATACAAAGPLGAADWNAVVLEQIAAMPDGGGYAVTSEAGQKFRDAVRVDGDRIVVDATSAVPSYCSSATYLLLLEVAAAAAERGVLRLNAEQAAALAPRPAQDGHWMWGRWNANGPGAARVFSELDLGPNFTSFEAARPGDFMKIFWTDAVGKRERGHLVVYLGLEPGPAGEETVRFWSSNKPGGYGEKSVPRSEIARAIFSRLKRPENLARAAGIPRVDPYLAGLLENESSFEEACAKSGATELPAP